MAEITIPLRSHDEAILVLGPYDRYAKLLRQDLDIEIFTRRGNLRLQGSEEGVAEAQRRIEHLLGKTRKGRELQVTEVESILLGGDGTSTDSGAPARAPTGAPNRGSGSSRSSNSRTPQAPRVLRSGAQHWEGGQGYEDQGAVRPLRPYAVAPAAGVKSLRVSPVQPRTENQRRYLEAIEKHPLVFGLGVAGTGKTYLAVTAAVKALRAGQVRRIVITRPVVEAGERLGFLPGDVQAKLNPYMRPIYDAFNDLLDFEDVARLEENGVIEIAPLAFMRGRTLNHALAILDEGQNTTIAQMKMFLTRLGEGSRMVVTGDPSQSDLEGNHRSGLLDAISRLRGFHDISVIEFTSKDIVRHPLVEQIVKAYDAPSRVAREGDRQQGERQGS